MTLLFYCSSLVVGSGGNEVFGKTYNFFEPETRGYCREHKGKQLESSVAVDKHRSSFIIIA
jgi:hypothetical protein